MTTARRAYDFIAQNPGCTSVEVAKHLNVNSQVFGLQRAGSAAIAYLRHRGLVQDCRRCQTCGRSQTRHQRNVKLYVTEAMPKWK